MATLKSLFHEIGNWHNKISIVSGVTRENLKEKNLAPLETAELKQMLQGLVEIFNKIEQYTMCVDATVKKLKKNIYETCDLDKEI